MKTPVDLLLLYLITLILVLLANPCSAATFNETCSDTANCTNGLVCNSDICKCPDTNYWNGSSCLAKSPFGDGCVNSSQYETCVEGLECNKYNSSTDAYVCGCPDNTYWNELMCLPKSPFGDGCVNSSQYESCVEGLECNKYNSSTDVYVCGCPDNTYWNELMCLPKSPFGDGCVNSSQYETCVEGLECNKYNSSTDVYVCGCPDNTYWNELMCLPKSPFGDGCVNSSQYETCVEGLECNKYNSSTDVYVCGCPDNTYWNELLCLPKSPFGDGCVNSSQYESCVEGLECNKYNSSTDVYVCGCPDNTYWNELMCLPKSPFGDGCANSSQYESCVEGLECNKYNSSTDEYVCGCPDNTYWNESMCLPKIEFNQTCSTPSSNENPCTSNLVCSGGKCACDPDKYWTGSQCLQKIEFNQTCSTPSSNENPCTSNLVCSGGKCACDPDKYWTGSQCLQKIEFNQTCSTPSSNENPCTSNLVCSGGKCACDPDKYWTGSQCLQKIAFGSECTTPSSGDNPCTSDMLSCIASGSSSTKTCQCPLNTNYWTGSNCVAKLEYNAGCSRPSTTTEEPCRGDLECSASSQCKCTTDTLYWDGSACRQKLEYNAGCSRPSTTTEEPCRGDLECSASSQCKCTADTLYWDGSACRQKLEYNAGCSRPSTTTEEPCRDDLECSASSQCKCTADTLYWDGSACIQKLEYNSGCSRPSTTTEEPCRGDLECSASSQCKCTTDTLYWDGSACRQKLEYHAGCSRPSTTTEEPCRGDLECSASSQCKCTTDTLYWDGSACRQKLEYNAGCSRPSTTTEEPCRDDLECSASSQCKCTTDTLYWDGSACRQKLEYNAGCSRPSTTTEEPCRDDLECSASSQCKCTADTLYWDGSACRQKLEYNAGCSRPSTTTEEPCRDDLECSASSQCKCTADTLYWDGSACRQKLEYNTGCSRPSTTTEEPCRGDLECSASSQCKCTTDTLYWDGSACRQKLEYNAGCSRPSTTTEEPCRGDLECSASSQCKCTADTLYWDGSACRQKINYNIDCSSANHVGDENPCVSNLICTAGNGGSICKCSSDKYWTNGLCVSKGQYGSDCNDTDLCSDKFHCISNICSCDGSSYTDEQKQNCYALNGVTTTLDLKRASAGTDFISLSWIHQVFIQYYVVTTENPSLTKTVNDSTVTLHSRASGTSYHISVTPHRIEFGVDKIFPSASITVFTKPAKPGEVILDQSNLTAPAITVVWSSSQGKLDSYFVTLTAEGDSSPFVSGSTGDTTAEISFSDERIVAGASYSISIEARLNNNIAGVIESTSEPRIQIIRTEVKAPDKPRNLVSRDISNDSITLSWNEPANPNGIITGYIVEIRERTYKDLPYQNLKKVTPTGQIETIGGLSAGTFYKFNVYAKNENYTGKQSADIETRTLESTPEAVQSLLVKNIKSRMFTVSWNRPLIPHGDIVAYSMYVRSDVHCRFFTILCNNCEKNYTVSKPDEQICSVEQEINSLSDGTKTILHDITKLLPETTYTVKVNAFTSMGKGVQSPEISEKTKSEPPPVWNDIDKGNFAEIPVGGGKTQTTFKVTLNTLFFHHSSNGKVIERGMIISASSKKDLARNTVTTNEEFKSFTSWHEAKKDGYKPYLIVLPDDVLKKLNDAGARKKRNADDYVTTEIGSDTQCTTQSDPYCNGPLAAGTNYVVRGVACTEGGCTATDYQGPFVTEAKPDEVNIGAIVGGLVAALVAVGVVVFIVILVIRRRGRNKKPTGDNVPLDPSPVKIKKKRPIKISDFDQHVAIMSKDQGLLFTEEYDDIQTMSPKHAMEASQMDENRAKNRYLDIRPFDHSRVKLIPLDDEANDYINANYIEGYNSRREYIAAQGPLPGTIDDFWRMIWEQNVRYIVMMTKCKEKNIIKCEQYWPEYSPDKKSEPLQYGDVIVTLKSESHLNTHIIRVFSVKVVCHQGAPLDVMQSVLNQLTEMQESAEQLKRYFSLQGETVREIRHFHYIVFGDHTGHGAVGTGELVDFAEIVRSHIQPNNPGPIVVHCSAGVGRTGTFISMDHFRLFLNQHTLEDSIDLFSMVMKMRDNRCKMVQNESQYVLIHHCVSEIVKRRRREIDNENLYENQNGAYQNDAYIDEPLYSNVDINDKNTMKTEI